MSLTVIVLEFDSFHIEAKLFDTPISKAFIESLPYRVSLEQWGQELFGSIGKDLGTHQPLAEIPSGGLAYTNNGNHFCLFFGQRPAWPVEYIGEMIGEDWLDQLKDLYAANITVKLKEAS